MASQWDEAASKSPLPPHRRQSRSPSGLPSPTRPAMPHLTSQQEYAYLSDMLTNNDADRSSSAQQPVDFGTYASYATGQPLFGDDNFGSGPKAPETIALSYQQPMTMFGYDHVQNNENNNLSSFVGHQHPRYLSDSFQSLAWSPSKSYDSIQGQRLPLAQVTPNMGSDATGVEFEAFDHVTTDTMRQQAQYDNQFLQQLLPSQQVMTQSHVMPHSSNHIPKFIKRRDRKDGTDKKDNLEPHAFRKRQWERKTKREPRVSGNGMVADVTSLHLTHPAVIEEWEKEKKTRPQIEGLIRYYRELSRVLGPEIVDTVLEARNSHDIHECDHRRMFAGSDGFPTDIYILGRGPRENISREQVQPQFVPNNGSFQLVYWPRDWEFVCPTTSLRGICQNFPNHMAHEDLDAFLQQNVSPDVMWEELPDDTRRLILSSGQTKSGSNVYSRRRQKRLDNLDRIYGTELLVKFLKSPYKLRCDGGIKTRSWDGDKNLSARYNTPDPMYQLSFAELRAAQHKVEEKTRRKPVEPRRMSQRSILAAMPDTAPEIQTAQTLPQSYQESQLGDQESARIGAQDVMLDQPLMASRMSQVHSRDGTPRLPNVVSNSMGGLPAGRQDLGLKDTRRAPEPVKRYRDLNDHDAGRNDDLHPSKRIRGQDGSFARPSSTFSARDQSRHNLPAGSTGGTGALITPSVAKDHQLAAPGITYSPPEQWKSSISGNKSSSADADTIGKAAFAMLQEECLSTLQDVTYDQFTNILAHSKAYERLYQLLEGKEVRSDFTQPKEQLERGIQSKSTENGDFTESSEAASIDLSNGAKSRSTVALMSLGAFEVLSNADSTAINGDWFAQEPSPNFQFQGQPATVPDTNDFNEAFASQEQLTASTNIWRPNEDLGSFSEQLNGDSGVRKAIAEPTPLQEPDSSGTRQREAPRNSEPVLPRASRKRHQPYDNGDSDYEFEEDNSSEPMPEQPRQKRRRTVDSSSNLAVEKAKLEKNLRPNPSSPLQKAQDTNSASMLEGSGEIFHPSNNWELENDFLDSSFDFESWSSGAQFENLIARNYPHAMENFFGSDYIQSQSPNGDKRRQDSSSLAIFEFEGVESEDVEAEDVVPKRRRLEPASPRSEFNGQPQPIGLPPSAFLLRNTR